MKISKAISWLIFPFLALSKWGQREKRSFSPAKGFRHHHKDKTRDKSRLLPPSFEG